MQSYFVPKRLLLSAGSSNQETLPALERNLFSRAIENADGKMTLANIAEWGGVSQHQARKLQSTWALRGWISKDGNRDNSFCITAKTRDLASNRQTAQTASNLTNQSQTQKGDQS
jgi:hypothetical protein